MWCEVIQLNVSNTRFEILEDKFFFLDRTGVSITLKRREKDLLRKEFCDVTIKKR